MNALASHPPAATVRGPVAPAPCADPSQTPSRSLGDELRQLLRLGLPIVLVQLGTTSLNLVDVALLGWHDRGSLPAMSLGNTLSWVAVMFCFGVVTALDPLLSQAIGAKDHAVVPRLLARGLALSVGLSLPAALLLLPAATWLRWTGQPEALIEPAATYARWQTLAILPLLAYSVLRSLLSAQARLGPQVATIVLGNLANLLLDWLLIFGHGGLPELGVTGAAIATVSCRWLMLAGLVVFGWRDLGPALRQLADPALRRAALAFAPLWRLLRLGAPVGLQFLLEMGVFSTTAILIGALDRDHGDGHGPGLGGHAITLQLASLSFMVPLGIGMAASVRVGWAVGRGDPAATRRAATVALFTGAAVMTGFMLVFLLGAEPLAACFTDHPETLAMAMLLIPIAGVFQIGDGVQVVSIGCLRGLGDMRTPVLANVVGYWLLGLPLGCALAYGAGLGAAGLWWGLTAGLFAVACGLVGVLRVRLTTLRPRLRVD